MTNIYRSIKCSDNVRHTESYIFSDLFGGSIKKELLSGETN